MQSLDSQVGAKALGPDQTISAKVTEHLQKAHGHAKSIDEQKGISKAAGNVSHGGSRFFLLFPLFLSLAAPCLGPPLSSPPNHCRSCCRSGKAPATASAKTPCRPCCLVVAESLINRRRRFSSDEPPLPLPVFLLKLW